MPLRLGTLLAAGAVLLCSCTERATSTNVAHSPSTPAIDGWPALHGPDQNSTSREQRLNWNWPAGGPPVLWNVPIGRGYAAPALLGDRMVVSHRIGDEELLDCLDPSTGEQRWRRPFPTGFQSDVEYSDGPYATPALTDDAVFVLSAEGVLRRVALATGEPVWERSLAADYEAAANTFAVGTSPLVEGGLVVVNVGGTKGESGIVAVDLDTGETAWTATDHGDSYATPRAATIGGRRHLFVLTDRALVALDPADGRVRWQTPFQLKGGRERVTAVSPLVAGDLVVVTAGPGAGALVVRVLPDDRFEEVWRDRRAIDSQFNNLTTDGSHVFGFTSMWNRQAELRCLDLQSGEVLWGWDSELQRGSSVLVDGKLILLGEHGHLAVVDATPDGPNIRYFGKEPVLEGPAFTAPALHRGRLYVRNEQRMVCLDLRSETSRRSANSDSVKTVNIERQPR